MKLIRPDAELQRILNQSNQGLLDEESIYPYFHGFESYSWNTMILGLTGGPPKSRPAIALTNASLDAINAVSEVERRGREAVDALPSCYEYLTHLSQSLKIRG